MGERVKGVRMTKPPPITTAPVDHILRDPKKYGDGGARLP
jgi:hypothetical protein